MIVRMRTHYAGPAGQCQPGRIINLPDAEARALIDGRYAEAVETAEAAPAAETTDAEAAETAEAAPAPETASPRGRRAGR